MERLERKLDGVTAILSASERIAGSTVPNQITVPNPAFLDPVICVQQVIKDDREAALILDTFRNDLSPHFPFIVVSSAQTVTELRQFKPFLFMSIMTVGCRHDVTRQTALARKLRELIGHKTLLMGERSLDLLQAFLVLLAWSVPLSERPVTY